MLPALQMWTIADFPLEYLKNFQFFINFKLYTLGQTKPVCVPDVLQRQPSVSILGILSWLYLQSSTFNARMLLVTKYFLKCGTRTYYYLFTL